MLENVRPTDEALKREKKYQPLKNLVRHHPYWSVILLAGYSIIVLEFIRLIVFLIDLSPYKALFLGLFLLLCLLPLLLLTFSQTIHQTALPTIVLVAVLCLLVGIAEEGLFRGLVLNIFLPKGIWRAVVLSALLFGSLHILNIFAGFPLYGVFAEMLSALGSGLFLAAVRVWTNSLRSGIIAHGLWDFPLIILNMHRQRITSSSLGVALIVGGSLCAISVICTLIVLRPKKMRELRVMYGFVRPKEEVVEQAG